MLLKIYWTKQVILAALLTVSLCCCSKGKSSTEEPTIVPNPEETLREKYTKNIAQWPVAEWYKNIEVRELAALPVNPSKDKVELIALGKALFFDPRTGNGMKTCASCHNPDTYWIDQKTTADGIALHHRNTPSMENVWYLEGKLFHDGRAKTYREQIAEAINSPIEMGGNTATLPAKLQTIAGYVSLYESAYNNKNMTIEGLLDAIAAYSKSISSGETAFDRFVQGDYQALNDQQLEGLHLFRTKGKCINCHNGPYFTDLDFHNLGYAVTNKGALDNGRFESSKLEIDKGKFRTPGLRNIIHTAPYLHNGTIATLSELINLLSSGMPQKTGQQINGVLSPYIQNVKLSSKEQENIIAFLASLSSKPIKNDRPILP
ncbi:cytochrome-c peroxidase [Sphingobacterium sp. UDSM-2020]|uniref:cytochrome-c peroxidase n=1 Tax=Sphingobacterium sp. UDSM-2020 TaxID=2795738 RepID=UPI0019374275|nr:cytochrome c peroxidase [Sphingobacterium sp. UDSM-2020]QQD16338.1 cytochrome-c peroxidase [Sphingobacterium sp. UDSM-2020]